MILWEPEHGVYINQWVSERGGGRAFPGSFTALAKVRDNRVVAGLVFHLSNGASCEVNIAIDGKSFPIDLLRAGLWYAFGQLQLRRLTFLVKPANMPSIELVSRLGAIREATLQDADITGDMLIYALFPKNCKIWSRISGKIIRRSAGS